MEQELPPVLWRRDGTRPALRNLDASETGLLLDLIGDTLISMAQGSSLLSLEEKMTRDPQTLAASDTDKATLARFTEAIVNTALRDLGASETDLLLDTPEQQILGIRIGDTPISLTVSITQ